MRDRVILIIVILTQIITNMVLFIEIRKPKVYNIENNTKVIEPKALCSDFSLNQYDTGDIPIRCRKDI